MPGGTWTDTANNGTTVQAGTGSGQFNNQEAFWGKSPLSWTFPSVWAWPRTDPTLGALPKLAWQD